MGRVKIGIAAIGAAAVLVALLLTLLALAWIKGGAEPMRWIEQPVAQPATEQGPAR